MKELNEKIKKELGYYLLSIGQDEMCQNEINLELRNNNDVTIYIKMPLKRKKNESICEAIVRNLKKYIKVNKIK